MNQEWNAAPAHGHELEHPAVVALPDNSPENKETLNTSGTFSLSPFYHSTPADGLQRLAPQPLPAPDVALLGKRLDRLRKRPTTRLLAGSVLSLKAWQLDMDWPPPWRAYVKQQLARWLTEQTGQALSPDQVLIHFNSENPAIDSQGHEHYDWQLSLTELAVLSSDPGQFLRLIKHIQPLPLPEATAPTLTIAVLIELIMKAPWTQDYQTLIESFWAQHHATYCVLAKLSFLDSLERQHAQRKISLDGYRLALGALGLKAFPTDIEALEPTAANQHATIALLSVNERLVPGVFQVRSVVTDHCFIHTLGDRPSCMEYISDNPTLMQQKMLEALNASPFLAPHLRLLQDQDVEVVLGWVPIEEDLFQVMTSAHRTFALDSLEAQAPQGDEQEDEETLRLLIKPAMTLVSAIALWQGPTDLFRRLPAPHKTAAHLMRKAIATHKGLDLNPDHVFIRYLRGKSTTPLGSARNPANQVHTPSEAPISLTQALLNNYRVDRPVGYLDNGGRTAVYNDPSAEGHWHIKAELPITAQAVEDIIKAIDFLPLMTARLNGFWDRNSALIEYTFKTTFFTQALIGLKQGHLSRTGFDLLVEMLEMINTNTLVSGLRCTALGFHVRTSVMEGNQCLICPGLLTFTHHRTALTILYQAGQPQAFVELYSSDDLDRHLYAATQAPQWRETLLNYVPVHYHEQLAYLLEVWSGQRQPHGPASTLRPWTDLIYNNALHMAKAHVLCEQAVDYSPFVFMQKQLKRQLQANAEQRIVTSREVSLHYWARQVNHLQWLLAPLALLLKPAALASLAAQSAQLALGIAASRLPGSRDRETNQWVLDALLLGLLQLAPATPLLLRALNALTNTAKTTLMTAASVGLPTRGFSTLLSRALHPRNTRLERFFNTDSLLKTWRLAGHPLYGTTPVKAWKLGRKFLLWTSERGQARTLVVSTHGAYLPWTGTTVIPGGTELRTYAPHGYELVDPGLHRVVSQRVSPFSILGPIQNQTVAPVILPPYALSDQALAGTVLPGRIKNYTLSKFQSTHGETYEQISHVVRNSNLSPLTGIQVTPMDVLTVRKRFGMMPPTLEQLFKSLSEKGIHYDRILLLHCRCSALSSAMGRSPVYQAPVANAAGSVTP